MTSQTGNLFILLPGNSRDGKKSSVDPIGSTDINIDI